MTVQVLNEPSYEPVSLAEARDWLRLESDDTEHDFAITLLIEAMRRYAENLTFRAFVQRDLRLTLSGWPHSTQWGLMIALPWPPIVRVEALTYLDADNVRQTLAADQYDVHTWHEPALILPTIDGGSRVIWPGVLHTIDAVRVDYVAGYPETAASPTGQTEAAANIPKTLKLWMHARINTLFENREQLIVGTSIAPLPRDAYDGLLDSLKTGTRLF